MWNRFATALSFLTIFRAPGAAPAVLLPSDLAGSFPFFPLVGLLLGTCALVPAYGLSRFMMPSLAAVVSVALMVIMTRGLHLDGLADLADGVGGGANPERRLEIMRDSRIGAFGTLALILAILLKVAALQVLITHGQWAAILMAPVFSRFAIVLAAYKSLYARREGGLAKPFLEHMTSRHLWSAALLPLALSLLLIPQLAVFYALVVAGSVPALKHYCRCRLGGITGDVLGAVNEINEMLLLIAAVAFVTP